jgi:general secretion pathway protein K
MNRRNRGAAIVLAMLIAALAAAVAVTVFADQQRWSRTVEHRRDQVQAQALVMAGVQWARQVLDDDARRSDIDHLREPWAIPLPPIPLDNGEIRGGIVDAQARLNINALGDTGPAGDIARKRIATLFAQRGGPTASLDAIADWIDADSTVREAGAEDAFYASQPVPGLAGDVPFIRIAEMASVKGVNARALDAVAPFLSALPAATPVNVNTAPPEVLATLVDGLDADRLAALVADRGPRPYPSIADFRSRLPNGATLASEAALSVKSGYFYVTVEARQGETIARARALIRRDPGTTTTVAWQVVE